MVLYGVGGTWCLPVAHGDPIGNCRQVIDPHTHEYMTRLRDEPVFLALAQKLHDYFGRINDLRSQAKVTLRLVEHFYYKTDAVYDAMRKLTLAQQEGAATADAAPAPEETTTEEEGAQGEDKIEVMQLCVTLSPHRCSCWVSSGWWHD